MIHACLISLVILVFIVWISNKENIFFTTSIYSLISMLAYAIFGALDVCMTEASLNVVISATFLAKFLNIKYSNHNLRSRNYELELQNTIITKTILNKDNLSIRSNRLDESVIINEPYFKLHLGIMLILISSFLIIDNIYLITNKFDFSNFESSFLNTYFINNAAKEIKIHSVTAAILAEYRGFDTLIETMVIIVASIGSLFVSEQNKYQL